MLISMALGFAQQAAKKNDSAEKNLTQSVYHFTMGSRSWYGPEALFTNQVAYMLYAHAMRKPAEGDTFSTSSASDLPRSSQLKALSGTGFIQKV